MQRITNFSVLALLLHHCSLERDTQIVSSIRKHVALTIAETNFEETTEIQISKKNNTKYIRWFAKIWTAEGKDINPATVCFPCNIQTTTLWKTVLRLHVHNVQYICTSALAAVDLQSMCLDSCPTNLKQIWTSHTGASYYFHQCVNFFAINQPLQQAWVLFYQLSSIRWNKTDRTEFSSQQNRWNTLTSNLREVFWKDSKCPSQNPSVLRRSSFSFAECYPWIAGWF